MANEKQNPHSQYSTSNFLPKITTTHNVFRKNSKTSSQSGKLPKIPDWKTFHLEPLPEIKSDIWEKETAVKLNENSNFGIESELSLDSSLRKSLTVISSLPNRRDANEEKSTKFMILEMNQFFIQMAEELRYLKSNLIEDKPKEIETILKKKYPGYCTNPEIIKMFNDIQTTETKLQTHASEINLIGNERREIHDEIRSLISNSLEEKNKKIKENDFPYYFMNRPKKMNQDEEEDKEQEKPSKKILKLKQPSKDDKNFVIKNIKLAKERTMFNSKCSLTDEEKLKLASLLVDIEEKAEPDANKYLKSYENLVDDYNIHSDTKKEEMPEKPEQLEENGFRLCKKDSESLEKVEEQLQNLQNIDQIHNHQIDMMKLDDEKPWREQIIEKMLKNIDKNLVKIANEKEAEETDESNQPKFVVDTAENEDIRKEYQDALKDIKFIFDNLENETVEVDETKNVAQT